MSLLAVDDIPTLSLLYKLGKLAPAPAGTEVPTTLSFWPTGPIMPSKALNDRVCLVRHDITKLKVDAITNAANSSLLGGGGIDGAIHSAAGPGLLEECRTLDGCSTGDAKVTSGHRLPAKIVIHAVGPVYYMMHPKESELLLTNVYNKVLNLAVDNGCKSLALCGISTGVYGYPPREAAPVAISTVKKFLEGEKGQKLEKVVFVTWVKQDVESHAEFLPIYFPPVEETAKAESPKLSKADAEEVRAAEEVASKLPDVPKSEPGESEHPEKKQRQN